MLLGDKIAELRKSNSLSQRDMANIIGVSASTIGLWERGNPIPSDSLRAIAELFKVSIDYLMDNSYQPAVDQDLESLQRAYLKASKSERARMMQINKLAFPKAFSKEPSDDTI